MIFRILCELIKDTDSYTLTDELHTQFLDVSFLQSLSSTLSDEICDYSTFLPTYVLPTKQKNAAGNI